jgi:hypothetical protein
MTEKQFEEFLRNAVRDFNEPPPVPRDAIWSRIEEARQARRQDSRPWFVRTPQLLWGLGVAAALILGIGIGVNLDRPSSAGETTATAAQPQVGSGASVEPDEIYRLVALGHLSRAEAFLTMFRADVRAGRTDYELANPARELLTTTRLLQGSEAARDARLRDLLDELELVLVQIAQLKTELDGDEAELVTRAMDERSVLLRLRAAADAGPELKDVQGVL